MRVADSPTGTSAQALSHPRQWMGIDGPWSVIVLSVVVKSGLVVALSWLKAPPPGSSIIPGIPWALAAAAALLLAATHPWVRRGLASPVARVRIAAGALVVALACHPPISLYVASCAALCAPALVFQGRRRIVAALALNAFASILMLMDVWHYRAFDSYTSLHLLQETANLENLGSSVRSMMRPVDLLFLIDIPLLGRRLLAGRSPESARTPGLVAALAIPLASVCFFYGFHHVVDVVDRGQHYMLWRTCWRPQDTLANLSPLGYHVYDTCTWYTDRMPLELSSADRGRIERWFERKLPTTRSNPLAGVLEGMNLLVIQVESLECFPIGQSIEGQAITPNLDRLARQGLFFTRVQEQVHNGTSSDSDLMVNASVFPVRSGSTFFRYPGTTYNSLPRMLEARGYETVAVHPDPPGYWNWKAGSLGLGFRRCLDRGDFTIDEEINLGLSDASFLRQLRPKLRALPRPFYAFCVTLTGHGPFDLPAPLQELRLSSALGQSIPGAYLQCVHYVDKHIGLLVDGLAQDGLLERTAIVIEGDHGGLHKFYRDELERLNPPEPWWKDDSCHVPLIVWAHGMKPRRVDKLIGQIDIMPLLADLMGVPEAKYARSAMGINMLKTDAAFAVRTFGQFSGTPEVEKAHAVEALDIGDLIIRGNYFDGRKAR